MSVSRKSATADQGSDQLARYHSMRDFEVTAEPRGKVGRKKGASTANLPFVVQKHAARQLHYDFRLGWNGVLKSWAVTKGPSYTPSQKRLAVHVEDHPLEYGRFEGTIPQGQYGSGAVMVWDRGSWEPTGDVERSLKEGNLKFELNGKKLKGKWALIRMHGRAGRSGRENWLLIKERDGFARNESEPAIVDEAPNSTLSGRSIDEIASRKGKVWNGSRTNFKSSGADEAAPKIVSEKPLARHRGRDLKSLTKEKFPGFIGPQLAQATTAPPGGDAWVHEIKLDGYRIQIHVRKQSGRAKTKPQVHLFTRKGLDWSARMPDLVRAAAELDATNAIIDGEAVALDENGISNFALLQSAFQEKNRREITYFAFDLLHLNGHTVRNLPLLRRKELLAELLAQFSNHAPIRYGEHLTADGDQIFEKACSLGAEGIVSKMAFGTYSSGRSNQWLKLKCIQQQELVIGGFTPPSNGGAGIGALLLGFYTDRKLRYAGRSGTGFTQKTHRMLRRRLDAIIRKECPFAEIPREAKRNAIWVKPELVAEIAFTTWTQDNLVRQASFKGLREDKPAREVVREVALAPGKANRKSSESEKKSTRSGVHSKHRSASKNELPITHPDKVMDEESQLTKRMLAEYYLAVADHMLAHVADRPLSVVRCPEGSNKPCFFQKHVGAGPPQGVGSVSVASRRGGKTDDYLTVNSAEGLVGLAQMSVLEIHPWGSKNDHLDQPDRIIIDLDPDAAIDWKTLAHAAREVRKQFTKLHLESFLKSTGGKGLHVVVPIKPEHDWPVVKDFAHQFALEMEKQEPNLYVTKMTKASRQNRIYLDYLRNDRDATSIAPFSPRARHGAPVAVPLRWKELESEEMPCFHVSEFRRWRDRLRRDPWKGLPALRQRLPLDSFSRGGFTSRS